MNKLLLYNEDAICDICGKQGATNDHGNWLCPDHLIKDDTVEDVKNCTSSEGHFWNADLSVNIRIEHEERCVHCKERRIVPGIPIPPSIPLRRPSWIRRMIKKMKKMVKY